MPHDVPVHRCGIKGPFQFFRRSVVLDWPKQRTVPIAAVTGERQVFFDESLSHGVNRNESNLVALTFDSEMHNTLTALHIFYPQSAQFLPAHTVIEQCGQDGAIANSFEGVFRRRL
jgi:hypothetical protein